jgi:anti-sigma regulatory factor (Ser/Thr protein kinase)
VARRRRRASRPVGGARPGHRSTDAARAATSAVVTLVARYAGCARSHRCHRRPLHAPPREKFVHEALFYDDDGSFLAGTVPFIRAGLEKDAAVMVAVGADKIALLQEMLGADAAAVRFVDMAQMGANPAQIIPAWETFLSEHAEPGGRPIRGIGEPIWAGRTPDELVECQLHEALLNVAFDDADDFRLLCPYDSTALAPGVVREACCSHPFIAAPGAGHSSPEYRGRDAVPPLAEATLPPPPSSATALSFDADTLAEVRAVVADCADWAGLDESGAGDFVLAVHELATNSVLHGGRIGVLRAWTEGDAAVCEVRDAGRIADALVGRYRPRADQLGGWGLWIANQACDLVQVRTGHAGTVVRVRLRAR